MDIRVFFFDQAALFRRRIPHPNLIILVMFCPMAQLALPTIATLNPPACVSGLDVGYSPNGSTRGSLQTGGYGEDEV